MKAAKLFRQMGIRRSDFVYSAAEITVTFPQLESASPSLFLKARNSGRMKSMVTGWPAAIDDHRLCIQSVN